VQDTPPSVVFQMPPLVAPMYITFGCVGSPTGALSGSTATACTAPVTTRSSGVSAPRRTYPSVNGPGPCSVHCGTPDMNATCPANEPLVSDLATAHTLSIPVYMASTA